jgi:hypothetical protein
VNDKRETEPLLEIVAGFAEMGPYRDWKTDHADCAFCNLPTGDPRFDEPAAHEDYCLWRIAVATAEASR